jgi:hypothetical protein
VTSPEALAKNPETVDPKKLATRVNAMYDSGRLQGALGEQGAQDLFNHANAQYQNAATAARKAATAAKVAKGAAKVAAGAVGLGVIGHYAKHLVPVSVEEEPANSTSDADTDAPDLPALSGKPTPEPALDSLTQAAPVAPKLATGRDYLDNPDTQAAIEGLYRDAQGSFNPYSKDKAEHLIALGQDGKASMSSTAAPGDVRSLKTAVPNDSQAIVHTHPSTATPVPSPQDYKTATTLGKPNFVISKDHIYVAMPGTDPNTQQHVKVADISPAKHGKLNIKWAGQNAS